ncbi:MAG TPA: hypothetical protein VKP11_05930, partial [Frankiaceae bacterium]|nr:hypothetical protein [Frankiaceae bacterium]
VLLGAFRRSGAAYPPPGRDGPGAAGGDALRLLVGAFRRLGSTSFDPDAPLAREVQATPDGADAIFRRPLPRGVRTVSVAAQLDLPLLPRHLPGEVCPQPTTHTGLPTSRRVAAVVGRFLAGGRPLSCPPWDRWPGPLTEAFGVPPS